jgi:carboxypeptidase Taq
MGESFDALTARLSEILNIRGAAAVLGWDQHVYMPPGGAPARGAQMGTLANLAHTMFVAPETGELISRAADEVRDLPYDSLEASQVRVAQRDYEDDTKVPASLVSEMIQHGVEANSVWVQARQQNDYALFAPYLQKTIELSRRFASYVGYEDRIYDALLHQFEPGMKSADVERIFNDLKAELVPIVHAIAQRAESVDDSVLHQPFDEVGQEAFGRMIAERFGYDFNRGRLDRTVHPFAISFSRDDVRITTRYDPNFLSTSLFGTMHEAGHAMYEQGIGRELEHTVLARSASLGVHESQSRLWENVVGRSLPFWQHFYPQLQERFPEQLSGVDVQTFYRAVNKVQPSLIRVEADEVTYTLHIMLRFEMEQDLIEGRYGVEDAPEVWNQKMREYLGITPPNDTLGILQDTHWSGGMMGYFPTYALGTILSLQLYDTAVKARPEIPEQTARGEFDALLGWLREHVHQPGAKFEPPELIERATGQPLQSHSYIRYLKEKYGAIYGISETTAAR